MNFLPMDVYSDEQQLPAANAQLPIKVEHTAQLIREFDSVFEVVELTHLTPPQTPPQSPPPQQCFGEFSIQQVCFRQHVFKQTLIQSYFFY